MVVVYSATRNLYPYLREAIASLLDHNTPRRIIVLAEDDSIDIPFTGVEVINVSGQQYFPPDSANYHGAFTYMSMMRLLYTELIPDESKVLQLDVDTIVCDSLQPIWDIDLTGKWFAAVPEYKGTYKPFGDYVLYYNVGVMVLNLEQIRMDNIVPAMVAELNRKRYWCTEQDVWNLFAVETGKTKELDVRFNETKFTGTTNKPGIVHFAGEKNWMNCGADLFRREYLERYRQAAIVDPLGQK